MRPRLRQHGFGLLELLAVMALGALLGAGIMHLLDQQWERARLRDSAHQHALLVTATARYLEARRDALASAIPANTTTVLPLSTLADAGYLAASHAAVNGYRQTACVLLRRSGAGALEQVEALVTASGGISPSLADAAEMAATAGANAGVIGDGQQWEARGAFGAWALDNAALQPFMAGACPGGAPSARRLVSMLRQPLGADIGAPAFLARRGAAADAPWNVMATPLALGAGATATAGAKCGATPAIAIDAQRSLLSCADGKWRRQAAGGSWKETRPGYSTLPQSDDPGDVRMAADSGRAYVRSGSGWKGLALDQNGKLDVPERARGGTLDVAQEMRVGNFATQTGSMVVQGRMDVGNDVEIDKNINGYAITSTRWTISWAYFVDLNAPNAYAGMKCNLPGHKNDPTGTSNGVLYPIGSMKHDVVGNTMTCQAPWNEFRYMSGKTTP